MACFATPYGLRYAAHCFNRAHAQKDGSTLIPAGGKLGVTSPGGESLFLSGNLLLATSQTRGSSASCPIFEHRQSGKGTGRSEEHTSELQSLMRISYAVFCLKKTNKLSNKCATP